MNICPLLIIFVIENKCQGFSMQSIYRHLKNINESLFKKCLLNIGIYILLPKKTNS